MIFTFFHFCFGNNFKHFQRLALSLNNFAHVFMKHVILKINIKKLYGRNIDKALVIRL